MDVEEDRNGNLWAWWLPAGRTATRAARSSPARTWTRCPTAARSTARSASCRRSPRSTCCAPRGRAASPVAVVAFADEEGARFGVACVGSQLLTGALTPSGALGLRDADGVTLAEALTAAGPRPARIGRDPIAARPRRASRRAARRAGPRAGRPRSTAGRVGVGDLAARPLAVRLHAARPTTPAPRGWPTAATRC